MTMPNVSSQEDSIPKIKVCSMRPQMYEAKKGWVSFDARMNATSKPPTEDTPNKRSWNKGVLVLLELALLGGIWGRDYPFWNSLDRCCASSGVVARGGRDDLVDHALVPRG